MGDESVEERAEEPDDAPSASSFQSFKRQILRRAATEDWQGLWEPLWWLRGGGAIAGQTEADRQAFAGRALRELHAEGLVFFFRLGHGADINASAADPASRLTPREFDDALRSHWWRGLDGLDPSAPQVWWGPTARGEAVAGLGGSHDRT